MWKHNNDSFSLDYNKLTIEEVMVFRFRAYITPIIVLFGIIGNCLVISIFFAMQRKNACRFNLYVIGIAVAHNAELIFNAFLDDFIGRGLIWLSGGLVDLKLDTYSDESCKFFRYIPEVSAMISTNLLVLFSIDRVITIYKPFEFRGDYHLVFSKVGIILIYLTACLLYIPTAVYSGLVSVQTNYTDLPITLCQFLDSLEFGVQYNLNLTNIGSRIMPTVVTIVTTILIIFKLQKVFKERENIAGTSFKLGNEMRRVIGHLVMTTTFFIVMIPLLVVVILRQFSDFNNYDELYPEYAKRLQNLSRLCSSIKSMNAVVEFPTFVIFLPSFRKKLINCFGIHKQKRQNCYSDNTKLTKIPSKESLSNRQNT